MKELARLPLLSPLMGKTEHRAAEARKRLANCFKYNGKMGQRWDLS
nr:MAG TPA_asm: hypothetical protein [Caudoviricetes sp.]